MKSITTFENKKILVLGLARSGEAAARLLHKLGAIVTVNDGKAFEENPSAQNLLEEGIKVICGHHPLDLLEENFELMVKNPGIPYEHEMVAKAKQKGLPILTEVELAYLIAEVPIVGITGSNGKTTTTTMIAEIINQSGRKGLLSGNIGYPASEVAQTATAEDTLVMELSSFQLMGVEAFRPHIAVITNLYPEVHKDYHGSFDNYVAAKWNIQNHMTADDYLILNFDQEVAKELAQQTQATLVPFSRTQEVDGAYLKDGKLYFKGEVIMAADQIGVPGDHNVENALASVAVAKLSGIDNQAIIEAFSSFGGVEHRLQFVTEVEGIKFYNDSKSTNILATQKALSGFENSKTILIAGGVDRDIEFDSLIPDVTGLKAMIVLGQTAPKLIDLCEKLGIPYQKADSAGQAAKIGFDLAESGDSVLLSPANASWDMYKNFESRGNEFVATVRDLQGGQA